MERRRGIQCRLCGENVLRPNRDAAVFGMANHLLERHTAAQLHGQHAEALAEQWAGGLRLPGALWFLVLLPNVALLGMAVAWLVTP